MDLYDKHVKCAYLQAEKHLIFVLEHKHILRGVEPTLWDHSKTLAQLFVCHCDGIGDCSARLWRVFPTGGT